MNLLLRRFAILCVLALNLSFVNAQEGVMWEHLLGPGGGTVRSITRTPDGTLFAMLEGYGPYRSTDDGNSWRALPGDFSSFGTYHIHATRMGTLLLTTSDSALHRSTDGGETWNIVKGDVSAGSAPANDSSGGVICAAADLHRIYRSTDDGATWSTLGTPFYEFINVLAVGVDGRLVAAVESGAFPSVRGIRVSTDLGGSWSSAPLEDENTTTVLALCATPDENLYAGTTEKLFRSTDGGATWSGTVIDIGGGRSASNYSAFAVFNDGSILVGSIRGVHRSTDGGDHYDALGTLGFGNLPSAFVVIPDNRLVVATYYAGIYRHDGDRFVYSSPGLPPPGIAATAAAADRTNTLYTVGGNGHFYVSRDGGEVWTEPSIGGYFYPVVAVGPDDRIYSGNGIYSQKGIIYSDDKGLTWDTGSGMDREWLLALQMGRQGTIYAGVERCTDCFHYSETDGLFRSTDRGETWSTLGVGLKGTSPHSIVEFADGTLFIGSRYDRPVMKLSAGDTIWNEADTGLPSRPGNMSYRLYSLVADSRENLYAATYQGLFRSSNRGASWERIALDIPDSIFTALAVSSYHTESIFAATASQGIFVSFDNGATWRHQRNPPGSTEIHTLIVDSFRPLIAVDRTTGLYLGSFESSVPGADDAQRARLAAHPNPAGARTTVEFETHAAGSVRLILYSSLGRRVSVIAEGEMESGMHRIDLDLSGYPPGGYRVVLEAGGGSEQVGVVVVR